MTGIPILSQFRVDITDDTIAHLIFDCPGRTMNVFSDAAIDDLGAFAAWLPDATVRGVVIRSGKSNAFCAGADLNELGVAYDMIMATPAHLRFEVAFDHFFRLSKAMRALETAGKPVAAAIGGLALGGGCELALAAHHRVLVDDPRIGLGLPESLVGLLPGAGGTQRLPRLVGMKAALPILLDGERLSGKAALDAGLIDELTAAGAEVAVAEAWILSNPEPTQRWDRPGWQPAGTVDVAAVTVPARARVLADTLGHYPAPLAILDCIEFGLPQQFDGAIRSEMAIFARLIQREEPRNMIRTMFLGKTDYDRFARKSELPDFVDRLVAVAHAEIAKENAGLLALAGFPGMANLVPEADAFGYWIDTPGQEPIRDAVRRVSCAIMNAAPNLDQRSRRLADYAIVSETGYPAYLGGPIAFAKRSS